MNTFVSHLFEPVKYFLFLKKKKNLILKIVLKSMVSCFRLVVVVIVVFIRVYFPSYFRFLWLLVCASVSTRPSVPGEQACPIYPTGTSEELYELLLWKP